MGKGGGKEADSCQNFGSFRNALLLLLSLSLFLSHGWHFHPLPLLPFIHFPSVVTETTNMVAWVGGDWVGSWQAIFWVLFMSTVQYSSVPSGVVIWDWSWGMRPEEGRSASQRADAGACLFSQNYSAMVLKPWQHMRSSEELFKKTLMPIHPTPQHTHLERFNRKAWGGAWQRVQVWLRTYCCRIRGKRGCKKARNKGATEKRDCCARHCKNCKVRSRGYKVSAHGPVRLM